MAVDRLVAQYGSLHLLDRLNCKPVLYETADRARSRPPSHLAVIREITKEPKLTERSRARICLSLLDRNIKYS